MNYSLITNHLKGANVFILKRLEILALLKPLDNETYEFVKDNLEHYQRISSKCKKLRVEVKSAHISKTRIYMTKADKDYCLDLMDELYQQARGIRFDIEESRKQTSIMTEQIRAELERRKMEDLVSVVFQLDIELLKELNAIIETHVEARVLLKELIDDGYKTQAK